MDARPSSAWGQLPIKIPPRTRIVSHVRPSRHRVDDLHGLVLYVIAIDQEKRTELQEKVSDFLVQHLQFPQVFPLLVKWTPKTGQVFKIEFGSARARFRVWPGVAAGSSGRRRLRPGSSESDRILNTHG